MNSFLIQPLMERNSRLSLANAKNKAEENNLKLELSYLDGQKKTTIRMLEKDKCLFQKKLLKSSISIFGYIQSQLYLDKMLKWNKSSINMKPDYQSYKSSASDISVKKSTMNFEQIHDLLFTNGEIDKEKLLCLHLLSAHRTECIKPLTKRFAQMCKIHSPIEQLLERSKKKNIHMEQKYTNILPIYTLELTELGIKYNLKTLITDGRLANRLLLNRKIRQLINAALHALSQTNTKKYQEIFEIANDVNGLKALFVKKEIIQFLDDLINSAMIKNCESFILTAPFRVKSFQIEIRTLTGSLEQLLNEIRQNVFQVRLSILPLKDQEINDLTKMKKNYSDPANTSRNSNYSREILRRDSSEAKDIGALYTDRSQKRLSNPERKIGRHIDKNFIQNNIKAAANAKKVEYDTDDEEYITRPKRSSDPLNRSCRRSSGYSTVDSLKIQPISLSEEVRAIMEPKNDREFDQGKIKYKETSIQEMEQENSEYEIAKSEQNTNQSRRKRSTINCEHLKVHLKQTTCPACMEKYKIPLPTPKTPRIKPSTVLPLNPGENPNLKTDSRNRLSMLIGKEMFMLQSYDRKYSSGENSRKNSLKRKEVESYSSDYLNLSPLELAMIEQEIKEKETQKKLENFLNK